MDDALRVLGRSGDSPDSGTRSPPGAGRGPLGQVFASASRPSGVSLAGTIDKNLIGTATACSAPGRFTSGEVQGAEIAGHAKSVKASVKLTMRPFKG